MSEPNYVVIRDPDAPEYSGKWFDLSAFREDAEEISYGEEVVYVPTSFIEVRDDGAVAQVYMRKDSN